MSEPGPHNPPDEAMVDLLIKQVTEGLSPAEQRELDVMDSAVTSAHLKDFERAAAAVSLASGLDQEPPAELVRRLQAAAQRHFSPPDGVANSAGAGRPAARPARASAGAGAYGWFAAAACLVLAVVAWNRPPQTAAPTPARERAALMAKSDAIKIQFGATKDPAAQGVSGDVVWDPSTQRGYLHFVGLAANDPAVHQYQLWIFDAGRDQRYPVDGGVFDIPANSAEVVIPIHAVLRVLSAKAFAVTVEKPGGAVVSGREHVVVLGAAG